MPETSATWFCRQNSPKSPQTAGFSRMASSAICRRCTPMARKCCNSACGLAGCNDQLHTSRRSRKGVVMRILFGLAQLHAFEAFDKFNVPGGLRFHAVENLRALQPALAVQQIIDPRQ